MGSLFISPVATGVWSRSDCRRSHRRRDLVFEVYLRPVSRFYDHRGGHVNSRFLRFSGKPFYDIHISLHGAVRDGRADHVEHDEPEGHPDDEIRDPGAHGVAVLVMDVAEPGEGGGLVVSVCVLGSVSGVVSGTAIAWPGDSDAVACGMFRAR